MSNTGLIIEERPRDLGGFLVGRIIPFIQKRMVGPFAFIDHMGPETLAPGQYFDVDQHPHIGLATLTWLLEGSIMHRDGIGTEQLITPGSVNFMAAGRGITHTERTPNELRNGQTLSLHGYQIWVALPKELEEMEPEFQHLSANELPHFVQNHAQCTVIAGSVMEHQSPLRCYSPMFMVEVKSKQGGALNLTDLKGEIGFIIVDGGLKVEDESLHKGQTLVSKTRDVCQIELLPNTHLLVFGGEPFAEERYIYWNFVSTSKERIEQAKTNWRDKSFPMMPNDLTYVPMPGK